VDDEASDIVLPELWAELLRRLERDQAARQAAIRGGSAVQVLAVDRDNSRWLAGVLNEHGWPGCQLVGKEACNDRRSRDLSRAWS
jgi:hypothetical protein